VRLEARHLVDLWDALPCGVALLDRKGFVLFANRALRGLLATTDREVKGTEVAGLLQGLGDGIDWGRAAENACERGRTLRLARQAAGEGGHVDVTLAPAKLGEGPCAALLMVEDVSETVAGEARLLLHARTKAIANLGDSVAHEIRNPLNSIHMNVQLLREGLARQPLDLASLDARAASVQSEIKRLDRVVRDFVQFSRPPALALEEGSINHVVRAALDLLDGQLRAKRLRVETQLESARPVRMDRDRIQRAVYNVLLNAVQALPEGGSIVCRSRDEERHCILEISDDGPGLDLGRSAHIFDLFYTTKPGGTGLGLPIANRIAEEHGGRMAVASEPGRGATFAFFLPFEGPAGGPEAGPTAVRRLPDAQGEA